MKYYVEISPPILKGNSMLSEDFESFIRDHNAMIERKIARDFLTCIDSWFVTAGNHPRVYVNTMEPVLNGW
jgi:hypothetical protein